MGEVCLKAQFRWELGETLRGRHFDARILTTFFVRSFVSAAISRASESDQFVKAIAHATEHAIGSFHHSVGGTSLATTSVIDTNDGFRNFHEAVENVRKRATELAVGGEIRAWRGLDVRGGDTSQGDQREGKNREFSCCEEVMKKVGGLAIAKAEKMSVAASAFRASTCSPVQHPYRRDPRDWR